MKGKYSTPNGETIRVHSFDEVNKLVCVRLGNGQYKHFTEKDYSLWQSTDNIIEEVEPLHEENVENAKVIKPKTVKKK